MKLSSLASPSSCLLFGSCLALWSSYVTLPVTADEEINLISACEPTIADIACNTTGFATLCDLLEITDLASVLAGEGPFTVFAPLDSAFELLDPALVATLVNDTDLLAEVLLYHVTPQLLPAEDLRCSAPDNLVEMVAGGNSRTLCQNNNETFFQKGAANPRDDMPEIIDTDIEACNGIIHVIDKVMLPNSVADLIETPPSTSVPATAAPSIADAMTEPPVAAPTAVSAPTTCDTIADIACGLDDFSTLCSLVVQFDLAGALSAGNWTVFAPTNAAFEAIASVLPELSEETVTDVLLFHVVADAALYSDDLECSALVEMANGKNSRTKCDADLVPQFQSGGDNSDGAEPELLEVDIPACNGVIHVVSNVLLPAGTLP
ncbi:secreted/surface protein with fasciclin-like repeat domain [Nitzschia inconspicua]|uniref:Secreted/surface protein with fasciclin-like repeat domain n=1 Tax=Nitzschia inconspicua TaxID=303405 RepID=A0A9K3PTQ8_9STRA|nr:secreted/surface protein with fasciclin-like repeat domain [Nitzschia inconspicua]